MKKSSLLLLTILAFSTNSFAASNMLIPILKCTVTKEEIKKVKDSNSNISEGFIIMADFENIMARTTGPAVIIYSGTQVGATTERVTNDIGSASIGVFHGEVLSEDVNLKGEVFVGDLTTYNETYKSIDTVTVLVDEKSRAMKAEVKSVPKGSSTLASTYNYNCKSSGTN